MPRRLNPPDRQSLQEQRKKPYLRFSVFRALVSQVRPGGFVHLSPLFYRVGKPIKRFRSGTVLFGPISSEAVGGCL
jgi:hypothetical protein